MIALAALTARTANIKTWKESHNLSANFVLKGKSLLTHKAHALHVPLGDTRTRMERIQMCCVRPAQKASMLWTAAQPARHAKLESTKELDDATEHECKFCAERKSVCF